MFELLLGVTLHLWPHREEAGREGEWKKGRWYRADGRRENWCCISDIWQLVERRSPHRLPSFPPMTDDNVEDLNFHMDKSMLKPSERSGQFSNEVKLSPHTSYYMQMTPLCNTLKASGSQNNILPKTNEKAKQDGHLTERFHKVSRFANLHVRNERY